MLFGNFSLVVLPWGGSLWFCYFNFPENSKFLSAPKIACNLTVQCFWWLRLGHAVVRSLVGRNWLWSTKSTRRSPWEMTMSSLHGSQWSSSGPVGKQQSSVPKTPRLVVTMTPQWYMMNHIDWTKLFLEMDLSTSWGLMSCSLCYSNWFSFKWPSCRLRCSSFLRWPLEGAIAVICCLLCLKWLEDKPCESRWWEKYILK